MISKIKVYKTRLHLLDSTGNDYYSYFIPCEMYLPENIGTCIRINPVDADGSSIRGVDKIENFYKVLRETNSPYKKYNAIINFQLSKNSIITTDIYYSLKKRKIMITIPNFIEIIGIPDLILRNINKKSIKQLDWMLSCGINKFIEYE